MAMQQFGQTVQTSFSEQLENAYELSGRNIKKLLEERVGYNALLAKKLEELETIESEFYELKQAISS